jgi:Primosomal protein N'' (replication factor Y) - superfamily II helicase
MGLFPSMRTEIASSDMLQSPAKAAALWGDMHAGKINILLGTQVAAKGHDIPGLTLVGVVDGDPDHDAIYIFGRGERLYPAWISGGLARAGAHRKACVLCTLPIAQVIGCFGFWVRGEFCGLWPQMRQFDEKKTSSPHSQEMRVMSHQQQRENPALSKVHHESQQLATWCMINLYGTT